MSGQRERAGSGETAPRRPSATAATLSERGCRSAGPRLRIDCASRVLLDLLRGQIPLPPPGMSGTCSTGYGTGRFSLAPTRKALGNSREGVRPRNRIKAIPVDGSVRQRD